jgi:hypothetical protein
MTFDNPFRDPHRKEKCSNCTNMVELIDLTPVKDGRGQIHYVCPECYENEKPYQTSH